MCVHNIKQVQEPRKGKESDSSKIACGFCEGSLAKRSCQNTQCTCCSARVHPRKVFHSGLSREKSRTFFFSNLIIWYISIYSTKLAKPYFFFLTDKLVLFWGVRLEKPETKEGAWPTEKEKLNTALCAHPSLTQTSLQTPAVVITIIT